MKALLIAAVAFFGIQAHANTYLTPCKSDDLQFIQAAMNTRSIDARPSEITRARAILADVANLNCQQEFWIMPMATAPEYVNGTYYIKGRGTQSLQLSIAFDKINKNFVRVSIR